MTGPLPSLLLPSSWILMLIHLSSADQQVNQCVLRCKDNHMREMDNEWSTDFTLPILNLLQTTGNETAAYLKAKEICSSNSQLEGCLSQCNSSRETEIILTGLLSWRDTCNNLDELRTQFPCWRENGRSLSSSCRVQTMTLRVSMEFFSRNMSLSALQNVCADFDKFSSCFISEHGKYCGYTSGQLTSHMFSVNKEAIFRMLKLRYTELPAQCAVNILKRDTYFGLPNSSNRLPYTPFAVAFWMCILYLKCLLI